MKIWAILSGCDWFDAGVEHLILPKGMDIKEERKLYGKWYREEYRKTDYKYKTFTEHLELKGAVTPDESQLEEYWIE